MNPGRPLRREGLARRGLPFAGGAAVALALVPLPPTDRDNPAALGAAAALTVLVLGAAAFLPWRRWPAWTEALPPLAYFGVVALLREAEGGAISDFSAFVALPVMWLALHGARVELTVACVLLGATLMGPIAVVGEPRYPVDEWRHALVWVVLAPIIGFSVQRLVHDRADLVGQLRSLARTDALTGLPNRRVWDETLPFELARARRTGEPLSVALLDLDRFKRFNDTHGHARGDRLLKHAAVTWRATLRETDLITRYGGEEFAVLLPACRLPEALEVIDALREETPGSQTCSAGIACDDGTGDATDLLARADEALYRAKDAGRDLAVAAWP